MRYKLTMAFTLTSAASMLLTIPPIAFAGPHDVLYKIPDTGQTKCYDTGGRENPCAGMGQDGDYAINEMPFVSLAVERWSGTL
jgi:hypothetical protein